MGKLLHRMKAHSVLFFTYAFCLHGCSITWHTFYRTDSSTEVDRSSVVRRMISRTSHTISLRNLTLVLIFYVCTMPTIRCEDERADESHDAGASFESFCCSITQYNIYLI